MDKQESRTYGQLHAFSFPAHHIIRVQFCAMHSIIPACFLIWEMKLRLRTSLFCGGNETEFLARKRHPAKVSFIPCVGFSTQNLSSQTKPLPSKTGTTVHCLSHIHLQETPVVAGHLVQCSLYSHFPPANLINCPFFSKFPPSRSCRLLLSGTSYLLSFTQHCLGIFFRGPVHSRSAMGDTSTLLFLPPKPKALCCLF